MRKNFLLLFLMALLPLASWAGDLGQATVVVDDVYYGSQEPTLRVAINGIPLVEGEDEDYTWNGLYYTNAECSGDGFESLKDAPIETVLYVKVVGAEKQTGFAIGSFKVKKAPLKLKVKTNAYFTKSYLGNDPDIAFADIEEDLTPENPNDDPVPSRLKYQETLADALTVGTGGFGYSYGIFFVVYYVLSDDDLARVRAY